MVLPSILKFGICSVKMETSCHLKIKVFSSFWKRWLFEGFWDFTTRENGAVLGAFRAWSSALLIGWCRCISCGMEFDPNATSHITLPLTSRSIIMPFKVPVFFWIMWEKMSDTGSANSATPANHARFATTHWSVVLAAGAPDSSHYREALEALCRAYWFPLYAYLRRRGHVIVFQRLWEQGRFWPDLIYCFPA